MTANTAQSEAWNGDEGQYFVAQRARHERMGQQHTARLLATAAIGPAEVVLDVGCGCGETTIGAARAARSGRALGVDLSAVMLAEARRLAGREGVRNARFEQADAQVHAFPAAGFDVAISGFGVMFFADPHAAFANIAAAPCWPVPGSAASASSQWTGTGGWAPTSTTSSATTPGCRSPGS